MATKQELFEAYEAKVSVFKKEVVAKLPKDKQASVEAFLTNIGVEFIKPKAGKGGGSRVKLEDVTKVGKDGKIAQIKCSVSGLWLPATKEYFYESKSESDDFAKIGLKRLSRVGEKLNKSFLRAKKADLDKVLNDQSRVTADFVGGEIKPVEAQLKFKELEKAKAEIAARACDYEAEYTKLNGEAKEAPKGKAK